MEATQGSPRRIFLTERTAYSRVKVCGGRKGSFCMKEQGCRRERPQVELEVWVGELDGCEAGTIRGNRKGKARSLGLLARRFRSVGRPKRINKVKHPGISNCGKPSAPRG